MDDAGVAIECVGTLPCSGEMDVGTSVGVTGGCVLGMDGCISGVEGVAFVAVAGAAAGCGVCTLTERSDSALNDCEKDGKDAVDTSSVRVYSDCVAQSTAAVLELNAGFMLVYDWLNDGVSGCVCTVVLDMATVCDGGVTLLSCCSDVMWIVSVRDSVPSFHLCSVVQHFCTVIRNVVHRTTFLHDGRSDGHLL